MESVGAAPHTSEENLANSDAKPLRCQYYQFDELPFDEYQVSVFAKQSDNNPDYM